MLTFAYPIRVSCTCQNPLCGRRVVTLPADVFTAEPVLCDRCGVPMACVSASAGVDPAGVSIVWQDAEPASLVA